MKKSDVDFSPVSCLPDDVVLAIFHNKLMDLKTLCVCQVVSKRFYAIVRQVDTIRAVCELKADALSGCGDRLKSISIFKKLKSVCINIPYRIDDNPNNGSSLYKWKVKIGFNIIDSFVIVLPTSIYDNKGSLLYEEEKHDMYKFLTAMSCFLDALYRVVMSYRIVNLDLPLLEKVSVMDSDNRGRVSANGRETIYELRNCKTSSSFRPRVSECYLSSLKLPVSGYDMKRVSVVLVENKDLPDDDGNYDRFIDDHGIDYDKDEHVYREAIMEIFKKHKGSIVRRPISDEWEELISGFLDHNVLGSKIV